MPPNARYTYNPPPLVSKIILRDLASRPEIVTDPYGRPVDGYDEWGISVWAHRRDAVARTQDEDRIALDVTRAVFTIRYRVLGSDIEIIHRNQTFRSTGPGLLRGGIGRGRISEFLEIWCERRT